MNAPQQGEFRLIRSIFLEALKRPRQEREAYLEQSCGDQPTIRQEVEALLQAAEASADRVDARIEQEVAQAAQTVLEGRTGDLPADPTTIGPYRVIRRIAEGGMGVVYEAEDPSLRRRIALKRLPESLARDPDRLGQLEREAQILASLNHPNIATIHTLEESGGVRFLTMELVRGQSLAEQLSRGPLDMEHALAVGRRIARALESAHEAGIIHLDLKPSNVMLTRRDEVKVLDFGIAKLTDRVSPSAMTELSNLDGDGGMDASASAVLARSWIAGTPGYMSPEQIDGGAIDARTDVFAFGCVMVECLSGRAAFPGDSVQARLKATRETEVSGASLPPNLPAPVRTLLLRCLAKEATGRPAGMGEIHRTLEHALEELKLGQRLAPADDDRPSAAHNLPRRLTRFVGRAQDIRAVRERLGDHRLVTLTGVGGCGKSRVAIVVAEEMLPAFSDGAWFVDLTAITDPDMVVHTVMSVVGLRTPSGAMAMQSLVDGLRGKQALLLIDNCEHLLDAVAQLVEHLVTAAPGVKVLATSREPLRVEGEAIYALPPLALPANTDDMTVADAEGSEAVQLFLDRAKLANPRLRLTEANVTPVVQICRRLDGIPLALELAASRTSALPVAELVKRLDQRLDIVSSRTRSPGARHQKLLATIDWSYDQLDEEEQTIFRRLAIFSGGWTADAAEAVAAGGIVHESDALDLLSGLVEKSLVLVRADDTDEAGARYDLLETLRVYARGRLEAAGETESTRSRHRDHYLALATGGTDQTGPARFAAQHRMRAEMDNLRAILESQEEQDLDTGAGLALCARLAPLWELHGDWFEGRRHLDRFLAREDRGSAGAAVLRALYWAGKLAKLQADFDSAWARFEECHKLAVAIDDDATATDALQGLGNVAEHQGRYDDARDYYQRSLEVARQLDDPHRVAISLGNLGVVTKDQGDLDGARDLYEQALQVFRDLGDIRSVAICLNNLGAVAIIQDDHAGARIYMEESLAVRTQLGDKSGIASALNNLGQIDVELGNYEEARRALLTALKLRTELGEQLYVGNSLLGLGQLAAETSEREWATCLLSAAGLLRERLQADLDPTERESFDARVTSLRAELGEAAFERAWQRGRSRPLEELIEELLRDR